MVLRGGRQPDVGSPMCALVLSSTRITLTIPQAIFQYLDHAVTTPPPSRTAWCPPDPEANRSSLDWYLPPARCLGSVHRG